VDSQTSTGLITVQEPSDNSDSATPWQLLTFLYLAGALLRYYNFWGPPLWIDEYVTWWIISADTWSEVVTRALQASGQSPFYSLVVKVFTNSLGQGPFQLRLPSLIFGTTTLGLVYPLAMRFFHNRRNAISSVVVFILSEPLIYYSQTARPYSLSVFLTLLSFFCFLSMARRKQTALNIGYVLANTLLIYSHIVFSLVVLIQAFYLILTKRWREVISKKWFIPFFSIALLCAPIGHQLINLYQSRHALNWIAYMDQSNMLVEFVLILFAICHPLVFLPTIAALFAVGFRWNAPDESFQREEIRLLLCWLLVPAVVFSSTPLLLGMSFFYARYFLVIYPAVFFLLAWLINNVKPTDWRKWVPTLAFAASSAIFILIPSFFRFEAFNFGPRWDWTGAVRVVAESAKPTDLVVYRTGLVEADLFADSSPRPYLQSYVGWPIIVNLPPERSYQLISLPFRLGDHTREYFALVQTRASQHDRVWVIGEGELTAFFIKTMISGYRFQSVYRSSHDRVQVTLLEKRTMPVP
jgi:dolichyl-phosphate-mannose-protein mannosyltransferase